MDKVFVGLFPILCLNAFRFEVYKINYRINRPFKSFAYDTVLHNALSISKLERSYPNVTNEFAKKKPSRELKVASSIYHGVKYKLHPLRYY